jgi:endonuclease/exonuclease/phosphatase (EEP) superfamily protein YafD
VVVALALLTRRYWAAAAAVLAVLVLAICVLPRWVGDSRQVPDPGGPRLRVMSVNMRIGAADPAAIVARVRAGHVDLLALQEFTASAQDALQHAGLDDVLPNMATYPHDQALGSALYSRYPLIESGVRRHLSGFTQATAALDLPGAQRLYVESVHPCAPSDAARSSCWRADLADQPPATVDGPVRVLLGDFNATLDHTQLRKLIATGYRDAADVTGTGITHTWSHDGAWYLPGFTLDHVLADRRVSVMDVSVQAMPGSDHRSIAATLVLPRAD